MRGEESWRLWEPQSIVLYVSGRLWEAQSVEFYKVLRLLGGRMSNEVKIAGGSAEEGPHACGGKSLGGSGRLNLSYLTCLGGSGRFNVLCFTRF